MERIRFFYGRKFGETVRKRTQQSVRKFIEENNPLHSFAGVLVFPSPSDTVGICLLKLMELSFFLSELLSLATWRSAAAAAGAASAGGEGAGGWAAASLPPTLLLASVPLPAVPPPFFRSDTVLMLMLMLTLVLLLSLVLPSVLFARAWLLCFGACCFCCFC